MCKTERGGDTVDLPHVMPRYRAPTPTLGDAPWQSSKRNKGLAVLFTCEVASSAVTRCSRSSARFLLFHTDPGSLSHYLLVCRNCLLWAQSLLESSRKYPGMNARTKFMNHTFPCCCSFLLSHFPPTPLTSSSYLPRTPSQTPLDQMGNSGGLCLLLEVTEQPKGKG